MRSFAQTSGSVYTPPGTSDFDLPPIFGHSQWTTKPIALVLFSVILVSLFFIISSRKALVVPNKIQFAGEMIYSFVRRDLAEEIIGSEFMRFVPFLFTLFVFILTNNIFGVIPLIQFPSMSHVGFPYVLAIFAFVVFHYVAIKKQGLGHYLKAIMFMPGVPKAVYILLTPIELATYFLVRPLTLSLRLFANMFAGNLLLLVFIMGGDHLMRGVIGLKIVSPFAFAMGIGMSFFEVLVQCLQAYIFTLLVALYIAGALADEH